MCSGEGIAENKKPEPEEEDLESIHILHVANFWHYYPKREQILCPFLADNHKSQH
ncbi:MAG: hypothetical protein Alis3KO_40870 [Aliiglaciecola sp.]